MTIPTTLLISITADALYTSYVQCLDTLKTREKIFQQFDQCVSSESREAWSAMDETPRMEGKEVVSVHVAKFKDGKSFLFPFSHCS